MPLTSSQRLGTSVALFRYQAQRLVCVWAHLWATHVKQFKITREDTQQITTAIQHAYWIACRRNPTVTEWVSTFVRYYDTKYNAAHLTECVVTDLSWRQQHCDDTLNVLKPYWALFQIAEADEGRALQSYAREIGNAFAGRAVPSGDWTDEETIIGFLDELRGTKVSLWTRFKTSLLSNHTFFS